MRLCTVHMLGKYTLVSRGGAEKLSGIVSEHFNQPARAVKFDLNLVFAFYYAAIDHSYIS